MEDIKDEIVVCTLGFPARELYHVKDSSKNFYMLGSMGMASSIGLGIALAKPNKKVVVLDGDGSILMNLNSLVTIACQKPRNFILVVLDNESYSTTGSQPTYAKCVNLSEIAKSVGLKTFFFEDEINFKKVLKCNGPIFVHIKVKPGNSKVPTIPLSPKKILSRFIKEVRKDT